MDVRDQAQLGQLVAEALPRLRRMVQRRLDPALAAKRDADDVLQAAFVRAQERWAAFQSTQMRFFPWIYRLVLDCMFDDRDHHLRLCRSVKLEEGWPDHSSVQLVKGLASPETSVSQAVVNDEQLQRLRQRVAGTLDLLRTEDREVLLLRHYEEFKFEEMAHVLGLPAGTVRQRYARARLRLRDLWIERFGPEESST